MSIIDLSAVPSDVLEMAVSMKRDEEYLDGTERTFHRREIL